jgi:hypothetical protein
MIALCNLLKTHFAFLLAADHPHMMGQDGRVVEQQKGESFLGM